MRYHPHTEQSRKEMLETLSISSVNDLFHSSGITPLETDQFELGPHLGEIEVEHQLAQFANKNAAASEVAFFVGAGAYKHHVPASVDHLIQRSEFLTSYTPYQPEISQGTLQYLFEFQTQVANLLGGEIANASLYDGSTATGEAVLMAHRLTKRGTALLDPNLHPQYGEVVKTLSTMSGFEVETIDPNPTGDHDLISQITDETSCVVVQTPDVYGHIYDLQALSEAAHEKGALLIAVVTEVLSLGAIKSPGEMGADIIVAEGQSIGNGLNFGGPYLGLMATKNKFIRQMPGRVCGETVDADGKRGFVLTLSTREQHIRREKATSNICTNSGLCSLAFTIHLSLLGETGLRSLAKLNHARAVEVADRLAKIEGVQVLNERFFNEFTVRLSKSATEVVAKLAEQDVLAGVPGARLWPGQSELDDLLLIAVTEMVHNDHIDALCSQLEEVLSC